MYSPEMMKYLISYQKNEQKKPKKDWLSYFTKFFAWACLEPHKNKS